MIAKQLTEGFDYVRVDLYTTKDGIYFGELTFAHGSGYEKFRPKEFDLEWGNYWELGLFE